MPHQLANAVQVAAAEVQIGAKTPPCGMRGDKLPFFPHDILPGLIQLEPLDNPALPAYFPYNLVECDVGDRFLG